MFFRLDDIREDEFRCETKPTSQCYDSNLAQVNTDNDRDRTYGFECVETVCIAQTRRYGEPPSPEFRAQLEMQSRAQQVQPLGGAWEILETHPWRRVELLRQTCAASLQLGARFPECGERISVRLRFCASDWGPPLKAMEETLECTLGDGQLPEGVERALQAVSEHEMVYVRCTGEACLRDLPPDSVLDVPDDGKIAWEVTLLRICSVRGVDSVKHYTNLYAADARQRIARASEFRIRGNALLQAGRLVKAADIYEQGSAFASLLEPDVGVDETHIFAVESGTILKNSSSCSSVLSCDSQKASTVNGSINNVKKQLLLNHALAAQKQGSWKLAEELCSEVLNSLDSGCVKALFRRGKSRLRLKDFECARKDLQKAASLQPALLQLVRKELAFLRQFQQESSQSFCTTIQESLPAKLTTISHSHLPDSSRDLVETKSTYEPCYWHDPRDCRASASSVDDPKALQLMQGPEITPNVHASVVEHAHDRKTPAAAVCGRVTVICVTTSERHSCHPQVYGCFACQTMSDKELVVIDTGTCASRFFQALEDTRVHYLHVEETLHNTTVGAKRNQAVALASGEFIVHFDDDDLYAPPYVESMLAAMRHAGAPVAKLSAWHTLDTESGICGFFDGSETLPNPLEKARRNGLFDSAYGFSLVYRREVALQVRFLNITWGEDLYFARALIDAGIDIVFRRDTDFYCLHVQHGKNLSRTVAQRLVEPKHWKIFLVQLQRHIVSGIAAMTDSKPVASFRDKWDHETFLEAGVVASMSLGTSRASNPTPAPLPNGLFVCSLFDEYYIAFKLSKDGIEPPDPLEAWCADPARGTKLSCTTQTSFCGRPDVIPDPVKPLQDISRRELLT